MANINFEKHILFSIRDRRYVAFCDGRSCEGIQNFCRVAQYDQDRQGDTTEQILVSVIHFSAQPTNIAESIKEYAKAAVKEDDVFSEEFLSGVILTGVRGDFNRSRADLPQAWNNRWIRCYEESGANSIPLPGPYVLDRDALWPVFRLYDDENNAFSLPLRSSQKDR
jgi:hypothetical protein